MYVEDLASLLIVDQNAYLSASTAFRNSTRAHRPQGQRILCPVRARDGPGEAQGPRQGLQEFMVDKFYWNTISGSPFYQIAQPWMKGYVNQAEFKVHYKKVWLD
jgi:hypothetical protein